MTVAVDILSERRALEADARAAAVERGHSMHRFVPYGPRLAVATAYCRCCGAWAQVNAKPRANEVFVGGSAVAVNCKGRRS